MGPISLTDTRFLDPVELKRNPNIRENRVRRAPKLPSTICGGTLGVKALCAILEHNDSFDCFSSIASIGAKTSRDENVPQPLLQPTLKGRSPLFQAYAPLIFLTYAYLTQSLHLSIGNTFTV